jgi:protein involved in polysaccharide export with SLBB domain
MLRRSGTKRGEDMSKSVAAIAIIGLSLIGASAQSNATKENHNEHVGPTLSAAGRARVLGRDGQTKSEASATKTASVNYAGSAVNNVGQPGTTPLIGNEAAAVSLNAAETKVRPRNNVSPSPGTNGSATSPSLVYRVGVGDVLDVQLINMPTTKSTLFTVENSGVVDYPLAGSSLLVAGLTTDEIAARLQSKIKVLDNPRVTVKIRDYASHGVTITGLVTHPGTKYLRREAVPFYVVLAEAGAAPEAAQATISRAGQPAINVDLKDQKSAATLVMRGDLIKISAAPAEPAAYYYTGGAINSPGQKHFHTGLTLTQAILASGGRTAGAGSKVRIARQGADGRLVTTEYNLRQIEDGKTPDPLLRQGDRIVITEAH